MNPHRPEPFLIVYCLQKLLGIGLCSSSRSPSNGPHTLPLTFFATEMPALSYAVGAVLGALIIRDMVKDAVERALLEERRELQERGFATVERIEDMDRKVSAIWDRIRAISGSWLMS